MRNKFGNSGNYKLTKEPGKPDSFWDFLLSLACCHANDHSSYETGAPISRAVLTALDKVNLACVEEYPIALGTSINDDVLAF